MSELFGDAEEYEHRIAAWKKHPTPADPKRVVLARVNGKMAALALPRAPGVAGFDCVCLKHRGTGANDGSSLLDSEVAATLVVAGCDPSVSMLVVWMAQTGSRINAVSVLCSSGAALAALADQSVYVASAHLRDPRSRYYNWHRFAPSGETASV